MVGALIASFYYNNVLFSMEDARYDFIMMLWLVAYYDFYDKKVLVLLNYCCALYTIFCVDCLSTPLQCHWE